MNERESKGNRRGWQLWVLGAVVSTACAAVLVVRRHRAASRELLDPYEQWWRRRNAIRGNGEHNSHLFV